MRTIRQAHPQRVTAPAARRVSRRQAHRRRLTDRLGGRAGALMVVLVEAALVLGASVPFAPSARATDPTPPPEPAAEPSAPPAEPSPTPDPAPTPTPADPAPEPTASPPDPTPAPTPDPATPDPTTPPDPTPDPPPDPTTPPLPAPSPDPTVAPGPTATPGPTTPPDPAPTPADPGPSPTPSPSPPPVQAPTSTAVPLSTGGLRVAHAWLEAVDDEGTVAARGAVDTVVSGIERYAVYRVRFQVVNDGDAPLVVDPVLAWGDGPQPVAWSRVPVVDPAAGVPFYAAADPGRSFVATATPITIGALRLGASSTDPSAIPVAGTSSVGLNPAPLVHLPGHSYTEVEFAVRATRDAAWLAAYAFRLEDAAGALDDGPAARVVLRSQPSVQLTPGQRSGERVADPLPRYPLRGSELVGTTAVTAASDPAGLAGPLAASAFTSPHTNYSLTTDACAACHASHTGQNRMLLRQPAAQATQCLTCHDGSGADSNVAASWSDPTLPANDPATSSWFAHPATTPSDHDTDRDEEFGGLLDRHAECADCHQPHLADASPPIGTVAGWTASGAIRGASGVAVSNGLAGTAPAYAWQPTSSYEYELCFKCHSGYTQLPAQDPLRPSRWALDKAVELNPANVSYHPVEAPGKNQTSAMALSLSGTSPAKLWVFDTTSTVRCLNCHGDADLADPASPPTPDARLDNHAGPNRGLLIAPYRDRVLKPATEPYAATDFALCYACHAEAPMVDAAGNARADTNFSYHGFHLTSIGGVGAGGLDIDVDGAGQGNAVCSECHFRTHGTTYAVDGQAPATGLVNFAPAVQPNNGTISFVPAGATTPGTCTLTCHGKPHDGYTYQAAP